MAVNEATQLLAQLRAGRRKWIDLEPGKRVQIVRPPETALGQFLDDAGDRGVQHRLEHVQRYVEGWEGITLADLLGAAQASADPAPFSPELWAEVVADRTDWFVTVVDGLLKYILEHHEKRSAAEKN